jgi:hypothetical protein
MQNRCYGSLEMQMGLDLFLGYYQCRVGHIASILYSKMKQRERSFSEKYDNSLQNLNKNATLSNMRSQVQIRMRHIS